MSRFDWEGVEVFWGEIDFLSLGVYFIGVKVISLKEEFIGRLKLK